MIYGIVYGVVALVIVVAANAYPVWREGMDEPMTYNEADGWHTGGTFVGILWPLCVAVLPVLWLLAKGAMGLRGGIVSLAKSHKARRERIALKELRQKELADQKRYVSENGPHRAT